MHASELWESTSLGARICRGALIPASLLYGLGWEFYLALYRLGIKHPHEPHGNVICVGNLMVGGSGKTPLTLALARYLTHAGYEVIVSSSGYGSLRSEDATLAPKGELSAREWGDEAAMMRWLDPDLQLVVGRNRVSAARIVHHHKPDSVMLMDDGFQHLPLRKHLSIILDPLDPKNRHCLPAGPYREPRKNRSRADLIVPGSLDVSSLPTRLTTPDGQNAEPLRYAVLCALGNPNRFLRDLNMYVPSQGGFVQVKRLPDHDPMTEGTLMSSFATNIPIVVTAKDWVKLRERRDCKNYTILVATQDVKIERFEALERHFSTYTF